MRGLTHVIIATTLFVILIILDHFYKEPLMRESMKWTIKLYDIKGIYFIYWTCAKPLYYIIPILAYLSLFYTAYKPNAILLFTTVFFELMATNTLKIIYRDSRPCFPHYILCLFSALLIKLGNLSLYVFFQSFKVTVLDQL